ncbi:LrgB family protein [Pseudomonas sp. ES1]|uniref:LrgB family protein n=1 Tax=Pseudomonas sp. ES1 TaxID=3424775 RepID=UPI003D32C64E
MIPLRTRLAKGAPLGAAAQGFGLSIARSFGHEEGAVVSLTMVLSFMIARIVA